MSFTVAVTDTDGDRTAGGNLVIGITDDAPVAIADTDTVAAGQTAAETGNVISGAGTTSGAADVQGADGALQVVSVAAGGSAAAVNASTGATIAGAFGVLTLHANGSYSYARATGLPGGNHSDTFTYTTQDADGSQSTATLTIAVADSSPGDITVPPPDAGETTVFEAGLPARTTGGVAEPAGSNPVAPVTTDEGTISFTSLALGLAKLGFCGAPISGSLTHARICQNGLRNRVVDRKRCSPSFAPYHGDEQNNGGVAQWKFHSTSGYKTSVHVSL